MIKKMTASLSIALPVLAAAFLPSAALAQTATTPGNGPNVAQDAVKPSELSPVKQLELSTTLAKLGRANKDPLQMIVAAQILQGASARYEARPPSDADASAVVGPEKAESVASLLDEAKAFSKNDKTIVAMADDVKAAASKGRVGGGIISLGQITGRTVHTRQMTFKGGQFAEVGLIGIDTNNVRLEIRDQGGHLICRDSDPAYCPFTPVWTGPFTVKVHNDGSGIARYKLETN